MTVEDLQRSLPAAAHAAAVVPSDSAALSPPSRYLYVGVSGDVKVDTIGGETAIVFKAAPVGRLDVQATKVYATGTTATDIVSLWG